MPIGRHTDPRAADILGWVCCLVKRLGYPYRADFHNVICGDLCVDNIAITYGKGDPAFKLTVMVNERCLRITNWISKCYHIQSNVGIYAENRSKSLKEATHTIKAWAGPRQVVRDAIMAMNELALAVTVGLPLEIGEVSYSVSNRKGTVGLYDHARGRTLFLSYQGGRLTVWDSYNHVPQQFSLAGQEGLDNLQDCLRDFMESTCIDLRVFEHYSQVRTNEAHPHERTDAHPRADEGSRPAGLRSSQPAGQAVQA